MYLEILEEIGLSPNEAKVYEFLVDQKECSVPVISIKTRIDKRNIYDVIPRLIYKGLIYQVVGTKENKYAAVEPEKLLELVKEKETKLLNILPALNKKYKQGATKEMVYIYRGNEGTKNYLRDALKVGEDLYFIGGKGGWFDTNISVFMKYFLKTAKQKKIKFHHIFDAEVKDKAPEILKYLGKDYKFFPTKYSTSGGIAIFGDHIVTFSGLKIKDISAEDTITVIINKELADCYRTWFQFFWDKC